MQLSISNIAWKVEDDDKVGDLLNRYEIKHIDIAPGKYLDITSCTYKDISIVKQKWADRGISIIGMQSLLYATESLQVFDKSSHSKFYSHIGKICNIGATLGATKLTFGSPRNRIIPNGIGMKYEDIYTEFFSVLSAIAKSYNVVICLEPNPKEYGTNFMNNTLDVAKVLTKINHDNLKLQFDVGASVMNNEDINMMFTSYYYLIGHIHISEPNLVPLSSDYHKEVGHILKNKPKYGTIEMLSNNFNEIEQSIILAKKYYE